MNIYFDNISNISILLIKKIISNKFKFSIFAHDRQINNFEDIFSLKSNIKEQLDLNKNNTILISNIKKNELSLNFFKSKFSKFNNIIFIIEENVNDIDNILKNEIKNLSNLEKNILFLYLDKKSYLNLLYVRNKEEIYKKIKIKNPEKNTNLQKISKWEIWFPYMDDSTPFSYELHDELNRTPELNVINDFLISISLYFVKNLKNFNKIGFYAFLKYLYLKNYPEKKFLNQLFYKPYNLFCRFQRNFLRIINVIIMIFLINIIPNQIHRFSKRKALPNRQNKYKIDKEDFHPPLILDKSKKIFNENSSEANFIFRGDSLGEYTNEINNGATNFIFGVVTPPQIEKIEKILEKNIIDNAYFVYSSLEYLKHFPEKNKRKLIFIDIAEDQILGKKNKAEFDRNYDYCKKNDLFYFRAFKNLFPNLPKGADYIPTGSGLMGIFSLFDDFKKINIFGWDFHEKKNISDLSQFQFILNLFDYKLENRGHNHFESKIINLYYAYKLSKINKVRLNCFLKGLGKFEKQIKNIEKVLYA